MNDNITNFCVYFKSLFDPASGITYAPYSCCVYADSFDDAQEKAIERVEELKMTHGEITSISKY